MQAYFIAFIDYFIVGFGTGQYCLHVRFHVDSLLLLSQINSHILQSFIVINEIRT